MEGPKRPASRADHDAGGHHAADSSGNGREPASRDGVAPTAGLPSEPPDPPPSVPKTSGGKRKALLVLVVVALLAAVGFGISYYLYSRNYVSTDNAQIDGDKIEINAPITGTLVEWRVSQGSQIRPREILGRIRGVGGGAQPQQVIVSPGRGTVAVDPAVQGTYVTAGSNLATAYDFDDIYATARIDDTDIGDVRVGALVDIAVDAYPNASVTGVVEDIQGAAAGVFSLFPQSNSSGNFQKVTQVIPVKIALTNTGGVALVPGMNITVHIHKR